MKAVLPTSLSDDWFRPQSGTTEVEPVRAKTDIVYRMLTLLMADYYAATAALLLTTLHARKQATYVATSLQLLPTDATTSGLPSAVSCQLSE